MTVCPPRGHGIWARGLGAGYLSQFDEVGVQMTQTRAVSLARELDEDGIKVWPFSGPADFSPRRWPEGLRKAVEFSEGLELGRVMPDPEDGWRSASPDQMRRFARELRSVSADHDVCITTFPLLPLREHLADELAGHASVVVQLYGKGYPPEYLESWFAEWERLMGVGAVSVGASLWPSSRSGSPSDSPIASPATYKGYLESLPAAPGIFGWPTSTPPEWRTRLFLDYDPTHGNPLLSASCFVPRTTAEVVVAVVALVVVVGAVVLWLNR